MAPRPASLSACTPPPDCLAKPYTCDRPKPVPLPTPFVVKNGSKIRAITSRGFGNGGAAPVCFRARS